MAADSKHCWLILHTVGSAGLKTNSFEVQLSAGKSLLYIRFGYHPIELPDN